MESSGCRNLLKIRISPERILRYIFILFEVIMILEIRYQIEQVNYLIRQSDTDQVSIKVQDFKSKMIFEASIPRNLNRAKAKKDLDLYECIYNQYIHENKLPKYLLYGDWQNSQLVFRFNYPGAPLMETKFSCSLSKIQQIEDKQEFQNRIQLLVSKRLTQFAEHFRDYILSNLATRLKEIQQQITNNIRTTQRQVQMKITNLAEIINAQFEKQLSMNLIQSNKFLEQNVKKAEQQLVSSYDIIIKETKEILENTQKNVKTCEQNVLQAFRRNQDLDYELEQSVQELETKMREMQIYLLEKIDLKVDMQLLKHLNIIKLIYNQKLKKYDYGKGQESQIQLSMDKQMNYLQSSHCIYHPLQFNPIDNVLNSKNPREIFYEIDAEQVWALLT